MPISSSRDRLTIGHEKHESRPTVSTPDNKGHHHKSTKPKETETIKPKRVTLPHISKINNNNAVGRSLSHGSGVNHRQPITILKQHDKPRSTHHPGTPQAHLHHKKRRPKKEKEGEDITLRKIRFFSSHPAPAPLTVCLSFPGVDLSHKQLLDAIQSLGTIDPGDIKSIQFVDMNCILGAAGVGNRWLITVKDFDTRYLLLRDCIWINDDPLHFRLLDDVNMEDYKEYRRRMATLESDEHVSAVERLLAMHTQMM